MMKVHARFLLILCCVALTLACRERTNIFDMGSDDFIPPPPIFWHDSLVTGLYHEIDSTLTGFHFLVKFADEFERTLIMHNELFYEDTILVASFDVTAGQGNTQYTYDLYGITDRGPYYFRMFFGGLPIGYVAFLVGGNDRSISIEDMGPD